MDEFDSQSEDEDGFSILKKGKLQHQFYIMIVISQEAEKNEEQRINIIRESQALPDTESENDEVDELREEKRGFVLPQSTISNYFQKTLDKTSKPISFITVSENQNGNSSNQSLFKHFGGMSIVSISNEKASELNKINSMVSHKQYNQVQISVLNKDNEICVTEENPQHFTNKHDQFSLISKKQDPCFNNYRSLAQINQKKLNESNHEEDKMSNLSQDIDNPSEDKLFDSAQQFNLNKVNDENNMSLVHLIRHNDHFPEEQKLLDRLSDIERKNEEEVDRVIISPIDMEKSDDKGKVIDETIVSVKIEQIPDEQFFGKTPAHSTYTFKSQSKYQFGYESLDFCSTTVKYGIKAKKFHYSSKRYDQCLVQVSDDGHTLNWSYYKKSLKKSGKFLIKDLIAIQYGSFSITFRQYAKDIQSAIKLKNQETYNKMKEQKIFGETHQIKLQKEKKEQQHEHEIDSEPFYCWQCVTLYAEGRTLDFVIEEEIDLFAFINYMQHAIMIKYNSFIVREKVKKEKAKQYKQYQKLGYPQLAASTTLNSQTLPQTPIDQSLKKMTSSFVSTQQSLHETQGVVPMRYYRIMKIKMKIAYEALLHGQTFIEFFINAILKTYFELLNDESFSQDNSFFSLAKIFKGCNNNYRVTPFEDSRHITINDKEEIKVSDFDSSNQVIRVGILKNHNNLDSSQLRLQKIQSEDNRHLLELSPLQERRRYKQKSKFFNMKRFSDEEQIIEQNNFEQSQSDLRQSSLVKQMTQAGQRLLIHEIDKMTDRREELIRKNIQEITGVKGENEQLQHSNQMFAQTIMSSQNGRQLQMTNFESNQLVIKNKQKELNRIELIMRLIAKRKHQIIGSTKSHKVKALSTSFYESMNPYKNLKVNDIKQLLSKNAVGYIQSNIKHINNLQNKEKAFALRKGMAILRRKDTEYRDTLQTQNTEGNLQEQKQEASKVQKKGLFGRLFQNLTCFSKKPQSSNVLKKSLSHNTLITPIKEEQFEMQNQENEMIQTDQNLPSQGNNNIDGQENTSPSLIKKKSILKIRSFGQALRKADEVKSYEDIRLEQLRIRQLMNLKAKGFYLDNAVIAAEAVTNQQELPNIKSICDTTKLLQKANDSYSQQLSVSRNSGQNMTQSQRTKKLEQLKQQLQDNIDMEFEEFTNQYNQSKKQATKNKILEDKFILEQQYFNPALAKLGQMRLVRTLRKTKTMLMTKRRSQQT